MDEYNKKKLELKNFLEIGLYVFLAVAATYFLLMFVGQRTSVHGSSMYPTLKDGDQLIVEKVTKHFSSPKRFDIIVFNEQDEKSDETVHYIKRVIGLPGETVEIKDGKVYIDGSETALDDSFIPEKMQGSFGPYTVPDNCYFMLGDNRNDSKDSRFWKNTFVRFDQIVGKAVVRYYPSIKLLGYEEP